MNLSKLYNNVPEAVFGFVYARKFEASLLKTCRMLSMTIDGGQAGFLFQPVQEYLRSSFSTLINLRQLNHVLEWREFLACLEHAAIETKKSANFQRQHVYADAVKKFSDKMTDTWFNIPEKHREILDKNGVLFDGVVGVKAETVMTSILNAQSPMHIVEDIQSMHLYCRSIQHRRNSL